MATKSHPLDSTVCDGCGAVFRRKTWRRSPERLAQAFLGSASWGRCPACRQVSHGEYFGRVVLKGAVETAQQEAIRRRVENVADRAFFTQPERRLVAVRQVGSDLEVLTTSQKLAHRIVHELKKAFGGRAAYAWSDRDGRLVATLYPDQKRTGWRRPLD